jgi:hypothetical protein
VFHLKTDIVRPPAFWNFKAKVYFVKVIWAAAIVFRFHLYFHLLPIDIGRDGEIETP